MLAKNIVRKKHVRKVQNNFVRNSARCIVRNFNQQLGKDKIIELERILRTLFGQTLFGARLVRNKFEMAFGIFGTVFGANTAPAVRADCSFKLMRANTPLQFTLHSTLLGEYTFEECLHDELQNGRNGCISISLLYATPASLSFQGMVTLPWYELSTTSGR